GITATATPLGDILRIKQHFRSTIKDGSRRKIPAAPSGRIFEPLALHRLETTAHFSSSSIPERGRTSQVLVLTRNLSDFTAASSERLGILDQTI
ncbi:MAG: hypothetical protein KC636_35665, partial [Myxococcales bacterium]|nr:hypothetical protein [Myxococcales bacterium]